MRQAATPSFPIRWCIEHGFGSTRHTVSPCEYFEEHDGPDEYPCQYIDATLHYDIPTQPTTQSNREKSERRQT